MITISAYVQTRNRTAPTLYVRCEDPSTPWRFACVCEQYTNGYICLYIKNTPTHTRQWADATWCIEPEDVAFLYIWSAV